MKIKKILITILCITIGLMTVAFATAPISPIDGLKKQIAGYISQISGLKQQVAKLQAQIPQTYNVGYIIDSLEQPKTQKAIVQDGDLYIPAKYVTESVGKKFKWDGTNKKIYISNTGEIVKPLKEVYLYRKPYDANTTAANVKVDDNNKVLAICSVGSNESPTKGKRSDCIDSQFITYALNSKATKLIASLSISNGYSSNQEKVICRVYDENDTLLYTSPLMLVSTEPQNMEVNVTGKLKVKIESTLYNATNQFGDTLYLNNLRILTSDY